MKFINNNMIIKNQTERDSNFELLRVVAIIFIIAFHIVHHGMFYQLSDITSQKIMNNAVFNEPRFFWELLIPEFLFPWAQGGNSVFILISGFYTCELGSNIRISKQIKKVLSQIVFAAVLITIVSLVYYKIKRNTGVYVYTQSVSIINEQFWFAGYYVLVIVTAYLGLNGFLQSIARERYRDYLYILFALFTFSWIGGIINSLANGLRIYVAGVFLYSLGGYIKEYDPFASIRASTLWMMLVFVQGIIYISYYNLTKNRAQEFLLGYSSTGFVQKETMYYPYSFVSIVIGITVFELFRRLKIRKSKVINYLGKATFFIYISHDNDFVRHIFREKDWVSLLYYEPIMFVLDLFIWTIAIFTIGILVFGFYEQTIRRVMKNQ